MISPHQPALDDAEETMNNGFQREKRTIKKKATDTPKFAEDFPKRYMARTPHPVKDPKTKVKK